MLLCLKKYKTLIWFVFLCIRKKYFCLKSCVNICIYAVKLIPISMCRVQYTF